MKFGIITLRRFALFLAALSCCFGQRTYTATPISITGYDRASLIWLGDDGKTGFGGGTNFNPYLTQCFTYQNGVTTSIATPGLSCGALAANTGAYLLEVSPPIQSFPAQQALPQLFAYRNNQFSALVPPDTTSFGFVQGVGVNASGQIAATLICFPPQGPGPVPFVALGQLCAYSISTLGVFTRLSDQGLNARASAINANGDIAGLLTPQGPNTSVYGTNEPRTGTLVVWTQGGVKNVSSLTGNSKLGIPVAINSKGQIVGPGYFYDGVSTILPIQMTGALSTTPISMNEIRRGGGSLWKESGRWNRHPFYYANGMATDLNALVPDLPKNMLLSMSADINNAGQILVTAVDT